MTRGNWAAGSRAGLVAGFLITTPQTSDDIVDQTVGRVSNLFCWTPTPYALGGAAGRPPGALALTGRGGDRDGEAAAAWPSPGRASRDHGNHPIWKD